MPNRLLTILFAVGLLVTPALAEPDEEPETVLQPILDDPCCVNPGEPDDAPLAPVIDEIVEINPGAPDDVPLDPVLDEETGPDLPRPGDHSSSSPESSPPPSRRPATTFVVYVPMRPDGTRPEVALRAASNGQDSEIWVDGVPRAVLKDRRDLTLKDLRIVYP